MPTRAQFEELWAAQRHAAEMTEHGPDAERHEAVMGDADQYELQWEEQRERAAELEADFEAGS